MYSSQKLIRAKVTSGFTLIELLVVIGIIGLLATIAVAAFGGAQDRAKDTKRIADMRGVVSAMAAAYQDDQTIMLCQNTCAGGVVTAGTPFPLNRVLMCSGGCATGIDVTKRFMNIANIKDPSNSGAGSCSTPYVFPCEYSVTSTSGGPDNFNAFFGTKTSVQGTAAGAHTASQIGIVK
jgi:prepilin-type N-terminal cleavage/methylation domain-containing protein